MSDPVSSMDVEDVLSSIRRLVSEEAKGSGYAGGTASEIASVDLHEAAEHAASDALDEIVQAMDVGEDEAPVDFSNVTSAVNDTDLTNEADDYSDGESDPQVSFRHQAAAGRRRDAQKLVLTAALRVADPEPLPEAASEGVSAEDTVEDVVIDADTQEDVPAAEIEIENTDEADIPGAYGATAYPHLRPVDDLIVDEIASEETVAAEDGLTPSRAFEHSPEDTLFDRAKLAMEAALENGASGKRESTPAEPEFVAPARFVSVPDPEVADSEQLDDAEIFRADSEQDRIDEATKDNGSVSAASPFDATGGVFGQPKPDGAGVNEAEEEEPSTINFAEVEESILDEDTLRDLVSDMVREELQGELGDRITRNVRKLVRREIQRSLASREFE